MRSIRVVGFDLDNTLYDQSQHMLSFFRAAAVALSTQTDLVAAQIEQAFIAVWRRRTSYYPRLFDEVLESIGVSDNLLVKRLVGLYHEHEAELTLFDGVREMLCRLRERFQLFMITDGNEQMQRRKIQSLSLEPMFREIVMTGSFGKEWAKPSLNPYRRVLERFGGAPAEYLYVGDNPECDFYAARQLGMRTARVLTEPFGQRNVPDAAYRADIALAKTIELEQVLDDAETAV
jgi:putative hydrolase of the HAD superfamily